MASKQAGRAETTSSTGGKAASKTAKASDEAATPAQDEKSTPASDAAAQTGAAATDVAAMLAAAAAGQGIQVPAQGDGASNAAPQGEDGASALSGADAAFLAAAGGPGEALGAVPGQGQGKAAGKAAKATLQAGTQPAAGQGAADEAAEADAGAAVTALAGEAKPQGDAALMRMHPSLQALGEALKAGGEASDANSQVDPLQAVSEDSTAATPGLPSAAALGHRQAGVTAGSGPAAPAAQQPTATTPPMPLSAVPIEIGMKAMEGSQSFRIRLHPEDLGQIDVKLHIDDDGTVKAQLTADRVETLAMLQRDAKTLERAFEQAGLKTSDSGLQFSLGSDNGQAGRQQQNQQDSGHSQQQAFAPLAGQELAATIRAIQAATGGLDIRI